MSDNIIEIQNLNFSYNSQSVLRDVHLSVRHGDFVAMIGPNGGGKTTLLKLMLGLLTADSGAVRIFNKPPPDVSHRIGYVPQDVHINKNFPISALDVVLMGTLKPGRGWSRHSPQDRRAAIKALDQVEMKKFCDQRIGELSGGQKQRVFVARALVTDPELLFLDEPTASIDTKGQNEFYALLKELNQTITIIVVSHDLMVISGSIKSVICVNQRLHYHGHAELTREMIEMMYDCTVDDTCPVELIAHGLPHRVLHKHERE
ncbi:Zinc ABC transporter, ATP-binding protein ZnuC [Olavius sp. associated proteobacterium Delta 1]|nr:Zinc ABC transporter, ATP-binding protein ZnuC [Olavius sp. associated proteobacterium Delta 1]